jgi:hypothetical protein
MKITQWRHHHAAIAPSKTSSPHSVRSSASAFKFKFNFNFLVFLAWSGSPLRLLPRLPVPYVFPLIMCFRRQFVRKMWPIQFAFLRCIVCSMFLSSLTLRNTSSFLHTIGPTGILHPSPATTFQNLASNSDLLSRVSMFQHHAKLCSKCRITLSSPLSWSPICCDISFPQTTIPQE